MECSRLPPDPNRSHTCVTAQSARMWCMCGWVGGKLLPNRKWLGNPQWSRTKLSAYCFLMINSLLPPPPLSLPLLLLPFLTHRLDIFPTVLTGPALIVSSHRPRNPTPDTRSHAARECTATRTERLPSSDEDGE